MLLPNTSNGSLVRRTPQSYDPESVLVIVCSTLALYNAFELLGLIFITFKKRTGLYFWSILLASFGAIPYCVGWIIVYFDLTYDWIGMIIDSIGWVLVVTAQTKAGFNAVFNVLEKVQMTCFCLQEFILSGLYIWKTVDILKTAFGSKRRFMWHLCAINVFIVIMDIGLLAIEYKSYFVWEQGIKVVVYSIKLKLEFAVLGELIDFVQHRGTNNSGSATNHNTGGFVELSGSRTRTANKKSRASTMPGAIHMDDVKPITIVSTETSMPRDLEQNEIRVTTKIDMESSTLGTADNDSTEQLYENVIRQVSRPT
ncbi:hypothetical protein G7Z17_g6791 [Cylindrodendrum hubeiense]|uniref:DUF7703 domain-containing protein n=1 Tax=Cylindrodendrum hubeiense TaxID=595255 RepID=A0A9P5HAB1_9HYPO|nr:hypothetical protein G7Z17_g6791 [Cylindrodendrum hubeiense]